MYLSMSARMLVASAIVGDGGLVLAFKSRQPAV